MTLAPDFRVGDDGVHGVGGACGDGDDGDSDGELTEMPAFEVKLNGMWLIRTASLGLVVGSGNVIAVVVTAEDGETTQGVHGDGDAGRVGRCDAECAFAERGDAGADCSRRGRRRTRRRWGMG